MTVIVGRDHATNCLKVNNGSSQKVFNDLPKLPMDVSEKHCQITSVGDGVYMLSAIKNVTAVNGIEVSSKKITISDEVKLGNQGYRLPLEKVITWAMTGEDVDAYDITPLKAVWERYNNGMVAIKKRQKMNNLLFRIPMAITLLGGIVSAFAGNLRPISLAFTCLAFVVMIYGLIRMATDNSIKEMDDLKKEFQRDYVCPNPSCQNYLNYQDYDLVISKMPHCPWCKAKFKKH